MLSFGRDKREIFKDPNSLWLLIAGDVMNALKSGNKLKIYYLNEKRTMQVLI